jgi:alkylation response protein AidB-like acyl-CoA dehydrogenase
MNERLAVGGPSGAGWKEFMEAARSIAGFDGASALKDQALREKLADWYVETQGLKLTKFRTMTAMSRGQTPGPEASITKLVSASKLQDIASAGMDLLGQGGSLMEAETPAEALFQQALLYSPGLRIAGGTDEVLRNIIAERVLGLPADMRPDKEVPFNRIPKNSR